MVPFCLAFCDTISTFLLFERWIALTRVEGRVDWLAGRGSLPFVLHYKSEFNFKYLVTSRRRSRGIPRPIVNESTRLFVRGYSLETIDRRWISSRLWVIPFTATILFTSIVNKIKKNYRRNYTSSSRHQWSVSTRCTVWTYYGTRVNIFLILRKIVKIKVTRSRLVTEKLSPLKTSQTLSRPFFFQFYSVQPSMRHATRASHTYTVYALFERIVSHDHNSSEDREARKTPRITDLVSRSRRNKTAFVA